MTCGHCLGMVQPLPWPLGRRPCPPRGPWPHLDACAAALAHCIRDGRPGRVDHGHEAHEAQVVCGEVHVITVEGKALGELLLRQVVVAETWWQRRCGHEGSHPGPPASCPTAPGLQSQQSSPVGQPASQQSSPKLSSLSFIHSFIHSGCILGGPILSQLWAVSPVLTAREDPAPAPTQPHACCAPSTRSPRPPSSR